jgi:enterochelin esterase-like enzyme
MPSPWSRLALLSSLVLLATAPPARAQCAGFAWDNPSPSYPAGVSHHTFTSPSMGVAVGYNVYVPPEYSSGTARYPVIYFLHGIGGDEGTMVANVVTWMRARVAAGLIRPAILVFPNGAVDAAYADAKDGSRRVMTMILDELIPLIDATWRTNACREQRAISGFSMGGHGALLYALRAPERFGSVVAYAPALVDTAPCDGDPRVHVRRRSGVLRGVQAETWARTNAATLARGPQIRIVVGDQDGLYAPDVAFDQLLTTLAIRTRSRSRRAARMRGCLWDAAGDRASRSTRPGSPRARPSTATRASIRARATPVGRPRRGGRGGRAGRRLQHRRRAGRAAGGGGRARGDRAASTGPRRCRRAARDRVRRAAVVGGR